MGCVDPLESLHCTTLHYTVLHYTTLYCTTLHCTALHYITLYCTALHYSTLYLTILHCDVLHCTVLEGKIQCLMQTDALSPWNLHHHGSPTQKSNTYSIYSRQWWVVGLVAIVTWMESCSNTVNAKVLEAAEKTTFDQKNPAWEEPYLFC